MLRQIVKIASAVQHSILPEEVATFSKGSTAPKVDNVHTLVFQNTGAITVTNLLHGSNNQTLVVLGDGFTTIQHNANVKNASAANLLLAANKCYMYICIQNVWYGLTTT